MAGLLNLRRPKGLARVSNDTVDPTVLGYLTTLSNWNRWGPDDQLGTLNHIDPTSTRAGVDAIRTGSVVSCARRISPRHEIENDHPVLHHMLASGESAPQEGEGVATDWLGLSFHGYSVTHLDSLAHVFWDRRGYNGFDSALVSTSGGASVGSVEAAAAGIATRGVLLDVPYALGVDWLEPGTAIRNEDLAAAQAKQHVAVGRGDALFVRTGRDARRSVRGPIDLRRQGCPGLHADCLPYLHDHSIAVLGSDSINDAMPSSAAGFEMPIHTVGLVAMGLWLVDNAWLEDLALRCREREAWDFLAVVAPLNLVRATGSPVNPLAIV